MSTRPYNLSGTACSLDVQHLFRPPRAALMSAGQIIVGAFGVSRRSLNLNRGISPCVPQRVHVQRAGGKIDHDYHFIPGIERGVSDRPLFSRVIKDALCWLTKDELHVAQPNKDAR